jgi:error-prone DNA polymerase
MTRHLSRVEMSSLEGDFVSGCLANEVPREVADQLFSAVEGFAVYGFCRSHAAAFARTSYETAWLKLHYPAHYYCGLLNNQPMGFYHPSVLVEDAKRHAVEPLPVHVNESAERCLPLDGVRFRVGLNYLRDLGEAGAKAIVAERGVNGPYSSFDDFLERLRGAPVNPQAVRNLVMVGAFDGLGEARRNLLWGWHERWRGKGLRRKMDVQSELRLPSKAPALPDVGDLEKTRLEYRISDLSTGKHLMHFWRPQMEALGVLDSKRALATPSGARVRVGGLVITRQAPATANKIRFFTLEDEHGHVNVTIKPDVYERHRMVANQSPVLVIDGIVQSIDGVWSLLATRIEPLQGAAKEHTRSHDYK